MHLSLGRIGNNLRRQVVPTRILVALWSFALILAFTPCCEVFATAPPTDHPAGHGHAHAHDAADLPNGSDADIGDGPCAPWLNVALSTLDSAPALLSVTSSPESPAVLLRDSGFIPALARRPAVHWGVHAPPPVPRPLYLRFVRFLE